MKRYAGLAHDLIVAGSAFLLSYVTVRWGRSRSPDARHLGEGSLVRHSVCAFFFIFFSVHRGSWRYVSIPDLTTIIKATVISVLVYTVAAFLATRGSNVPRSVPVLTTLYMIAGLSAPRLAYRLFLEHRLTFPLPAHQRRAKKRYVLLYGLTDSRRGFHPVHSARCQSRDRGCRHPG